MANHEILIGEGGLQLPENTDIYFRLPVKQRAVHMAKVVMCPVNKGLIEGSVPGFNAEKIEKRYGETGFVFSLFTQKALEINNLALYEELLTPNERLYNEPYGKVDSLFDMPESYEYEIPPMADLVGYALPRIYWAIAGDRDHRNAKSIIMAENCLEPLIKYSPNALTLTATFVDRAMELGVPFDNLIGHVIPLGILEEQNIKQRYLDFIKVVKKHAPKFYDRYSTLTSQEARDFGSLTIKEIQNWQPKYVRGNLN